MGAREVAGGPTESAMVAGIAFSATECTVGEARYAGLIASRRVSVT